MLMRRVRGLLPVPAGTAAHDRSTPDEGSAVPDSHAQLRGAHESLSCHDVHRPDPGSAGRSEGR
jgi:hypothetical protein